MLLRVEDVRFRAPYSNKWILGGKSLCLSSEKGNLLWGNNGSGKSTLGKVLCGVIPLLEQGDFSGVVELDGKRFDRRTLPHVVSYLFQNPDRYLIEHRTLPELAYAGRVNRALAESARSLVAFAEANQFLSDLSSGQRQRIAVAAALTSDAPLKVLDEPLAFLDSEARTAAVSLMEACVRQESLVVCLDNSKSLAGWNDYEVTSEAHWEPAVLATSLANRPIGSELVTFSGAVAERGGFRLELTLRLHEGECVGLVGPNGSGKTTALLAVAGLLKTGRYGVRLGGRENRRKQLWELARISFQDVDRQLFQPTVEAELEFGLRWGAARRPFREALAALGVNNPVSLERDPSTLSYGERRLVCILSTVALEPRILVLDEPFAGLDAKSCALVVAVVAQFVAGGGAVVMSGHDVDRLAKVCHRIVTVEREPNMRIARVG